MMKKEILLSGSMLLFLLMGCESETNDEPSQISDVTGEENDLRTLDGVDMETLTEEQEIKELEEMEMKIVNDSDYDISYGQSYYIDRWNGEEWEEFTMTEAVTLEAYPVESGQERTMEHSLYPNPDDEIEYEVGEVYRIRKDFHRDQDRPINQEDNYFMVDVFEIVEDE